MIDREAVTVIRPRLRYTWRPFFGRFGKLTDVQLATIPAVLDGASVVVMAPTASGKTEAVAAPIAERHRLERWEGLAVLYVVPTRALANDTLVRIGGPIEDMGMRIALKHGDRPYLPDDLDWLITTPESLDSLLCRRSELFATLRAVVIDEIHLLDGTYRGDQLRALLMRLQTAAQIEFAIHLISATLPNPDQVAQRYTQTYQLVQVAGGRESSLHYVGSHREIKDLAQANGWKKVLYFCNRREMVEQTAAELTSLWRPYPVVAHHGSLTRTKREEAEQVLRERSPAVGVATSTLEVGIDIGDIDLVVLAETPWSISAMMQRIGRGCRRAGRIQAAALIATSEEHHLVETMFDRAANGVLDVEPYSPDWSVVVQQILSIVFQYRGTGARADDIRSALSILSPDNITDMILDHLGTRDYLVRRGERWFPTTTVMDEAERGNIHSNIPDSTSYRVIDVDSLQEIGTIAGVFDDVFLLARQAWQVVDVHQTTIRVRRYRGAAKAAVFKSHHHSGQFYRLLPQVLKGL